MTLRRRIAARCLATLTILVAAPTVPQAPAGAREGAGGADSPPPPGLRLTARTAWGGPLSAARGGWGAGSWEVELHTGPGAVGSWRLRAGGTAPGAVPWGRQAPSAHPREFAGVRWEGDGLAVGVQFSSGEPYRGFTGPLGLADGSAFENGSRLWEAQAAGPGWSARLVHAAGLPLWRVHNRTLAGQAWAGEASVGPGHLQAAYADTGPHLLAFETMPPLAARRVQAAAAGGMGGPLGRQGAWTAQLAVSQSAERDGDRLAVEEGWAISLQAHGPSARPRWRASVGAVSPDFGSPLWGDEAPARDRLAAQARWSWPAGRRRAGGWVEAEGSRTFRGEWVKLGAQAGVGRPTAGGLVKVAIGAGLAEGGAAFRPTASIAWEGGAAGVLASVDEAASVLARGWVEGTRWRLEAAVWPASRIVRVEWEAPAEPARGGGVLRGVRLVAKWQAQTGRHHFYAEAGWAPGGGEDGGFAAGIRVGRWDGGRPERFFDGEPLRVLVMMAWGSE